MTATQVFLVIVGATVLVAFIAGAYFLVVAKWDADERNSERNLGDFKNHGDE